MTGRARGMTPAIANLEFAGNAARKGKKSQCLARPTA